MKDVIELGKQRASEIGLETVGGWYRVNDVHSVLGEGIECETVKTGGGNWYASTIGCQDHTHTSLLIAIRPIEKPRADTAESLVKEFLNDPRLMKPFQSGDPIGEAVYAFCTRAKAYLKERGGE